MGEAVICPFNSLTGPPTVLKPPRPSRTLPPSQVPANWAVLQIPAQSLKSFLTLAGIVFVAVLIEISLIYINKVWGATSDSPSA